MPAEAFAVLSNEEKARIRHHFGYPQSDPVTDIQLGVPALTQTAFILEGQMNRVPESRMTIARMLLGRLDTLENALFESATMLAAEKVDEITINLDQPNALEREYVRWLGRLEDFFGANRNPYSNRWSGTGVLPLNIPRARC
jgi:hypothetical protein